MKKLQALKIHFVSYVSARGTRTPSYQDEQCATCPWICLTFTTEIGQQVTECLTFTRNVTHPRHQKEHLKYTVAQVSTLKGFTRYYRCRLWPLLCCLWTKQSHIIWSLFHRAVSDITWPPQPDYIHVLNSFIHLFIWSHVSVHLMNVSLNLTLFELFLVSTKS